MNDENLVMVNKVWIEKVDTLIKTILSQVRETGQPIKPGYLRFEMRNQTEADLHELVKSLRIREAVIAAVEEAKPTLRQRWKDILTDTAWWGRSLVRR